MQDGNACKVTHKYALRKNRMQEDLATDRNTNFLCLDRLERIETSYF